MNEIAMQLHSIIINDHNKRNPLRTWSDAYWFYMWIEGIEGFWHCVWLAIIPVQREKLLLQKLAKYGWFLILSEQQKMIVAGARKGQQMLIQNLASLLYPLVGREIIHNDISPPRPVMKHSKNNFEILPEEEGQFHQTQLENSISLHD